MNFYISVNNTKLHRRRKVPKDAINAFDLRPCKYKLRNKPRGFPGSTGPPGFCSTKLTNVKFYIMVIATLSYKITNVNFILL